MSITVEGTAVKPHRTQPAWGEEDFSECSEILHVTLPREVITSPLGDGFLEFSLSLRSIYPLASLSA